MVIVVVLGEEDSDDCGDGETVLVVSGHDGSSGHRSGNGKGSNTERRGGSGLVEETDLVRGGSKNFWIIRIKGDLPVTLRGVWG